MGGFRAVLLKDLRLELRGGDTIVAMIVLSLLVLVALVFAVGPSGAHAYGLAAGALWISMIFAGLAGASRAFSAEQQNGCFEALVLSPLGRSTLYGAKLAASAISMTLCGLAAIILVVLFFNLEFSLGLARLLGIYMLGVAGFAALATLLAVISGRLGTSEILLPLLAVPMYAPALIAGVKAAAAVLAGAALGEFTQWLKVLVAFDVLFVVAGLLMFEYVVADAGSPP
jgi:heme exporter protein CcmB